jgi:hypothetical protein
MNEQAKNKLESTNFLFSLNLISSKAVESVFCENENSLATKATHLPTLLVFSSLSSVVGNE